MGTTQWARFRDRIEQAEVEAAFARFLRIEPPRIQPFRDSLVETMPDLPHEPITEKLKNEPVESQVETLSQNPVFIQEYLPERTEVFPGFRTGALREPRERVLYHIPKYLPGSGFFVGESTRREFAQEVDIMGLPAFSMCAAYNQGMSKMKGYQYSDYEDHLHLAAMAYCDVSFADGRTCEAEAGKVQNPAYAEWRPRGTWWPAAGPCCTASTRWCWGSSSSRRPSRSGATAGAGTATSRTPGTSSTSSSWSSACCRWEGNTRRCCGWRGCCGPCGW